MSPSAWASRDASLVVQLNFFWGDEVPMKKRFRIKFLTAFLIVVLWSSVCGSGLNQAFAQGGNEQVSTQELTTDNTARWDLSIAIAVSIGLSCLGAGYAVGRVGAAAMGAASEKPELLTRSLIFVALAEGIAIYGLLIAILLWIKL